ncbi:MAG: DNA cytosine methyltransferase [Chloroflexota bacterium]
MISLFSGAGGLDYGLEAAGFDIGAANDQDHDSVATLQQNRPWPVIEGNIFDIESGALLAAARALPGDVDLVVGGPPCQPFSKAGFWVSGDTRRLQDPRADTLSAYLRVVADTRPRAFLLENVEGLAYSGKSEGLAFLYREIRRINRELGTAYAPQFSVLNASDLGVPQVRRRAFVIAARDGSEFRFPKSLSEVVPSERPRTACDGTSYYRNSWDALGSDLLDEAEILSVRGKWAGLLPSIPEGQNYLWHTNRGGGLPLFGWRRHYWGFLLKLAKDRPSWTIQAQPGPAIGPFHWASRRLSQRELCRLQTFPDDVRVAGSAVSVQRQVGNAVPSLLAEVLGREIRTQLLGLPAFSEGLTLLPPVRSPIPEPAAAAEVPSEYLSRLGEHEPHPGTGRGSRARHRYATPAAAAMLF